MKKSIRLLLATLVVLALVGSQRSNSLAQDEPQADSAVYLPIIASEEPGLTAPVPSQPGDPKPATDATKAVNAAYQNDLPFDDTQSFTDALRGLIAPVPNTVIMTDKGRVVWDPQKYAFVTIEAPVPETVNPSLWRQSQLVNISGLFTVTQRIYQVRNYDLANMTLIEGDSGIIVVDPLTSKETAAAALALYYQYRPQKPVVAVIYSHSHIDHFGGALGVTTQADVEAGKVAVYAPAGFMEHASSENIYAGNVMGRRAKYMYGNMLPADEQGSVGAGLGLTLSGGTPTLLAPTVIIAESGPVTIDGLTMHNIYSLRGAQPRDALAWSKYLNEAITRWGGDVEVLYNMHHWPVWGNAQVVEHLTLQRDLYRYLNDQTLRLANQGYTPTEIAEMLKLPAVQEQTWSSRGYYGSLSHDIKGVYDKYLGWFDGNPANLNPLPPVESSKKYVELMGGADAVLAAAQTAYDNGEYRWVAELVNHVVFADPNNMQARDLEADALEQMGYQAESGPWRNFYLTGAQELRHGVDPNADTGTQGGLEVLSAIDKEQLFDFIAVHLDGPGAEGKHIILNWNFSGTGEQYVTELIHSVINHTANAQSPNADATITLSQRTVGEILLGDTTADQAINGGLIQITGSKVKVLQFFAQLQKFDQYFNIVTP
jgi:alkyl sulfatase BDS1-like metallo-beta-lactamase superfamily hydrolase